MPAPFKTHGVKLVVLALIGVSPGYIMFRWALDFASLAAIELCNTTICSSCGSAVRRQPFWAGK